MYVITVLFSIKPQHITAFMQAIVSNARTSEAEEPGCKQFDVCVSASDSHDVFLYEVYDSKDAFDAHLASMHYRQFSEITAAWVNAKVIHVFERTHPHAAADV